MSTEDSYYDDLCISLPQSLSRVDDLSQSALTTVFTPLLPPIFSKQEIIVSLQKYKKVCVGLGERLACLSFLTDYVVSAIAFPTMLDIFQLDTSNRSKKWIMEMVSREWLGVFKSFTISKPRKEVMEILLIFLRRMTRLLSTYDINISKMLLSSVNDNCFWSYGLLSVDGREAPVKLALKSPTIKQAFNMIDKNIDAIQMEEKQLKCDYFGPTDKDFKSMDTHIPTSTIASSSNANFSLTDTSTISSVHVGVKRMHVASLQLKCGVEQQIACRVEADKVVLSITSKCGDSATVSLGMKELSAGLTSLAGEQLLFLYLTAPGCLAVQSRFDVLPDMSVPPLALLGGENRRVVVFCKKIVSDEGERLINALRVLLADKFAVITQSSAKRLLAKTVDHIKLFPALTDKTNVGVVKGVKQPRYGDRKTGDKGGTVSGGGKLSLVSMYGGETVSGGSHYWSDPAILLSTKVVQDTPLDLSSSLPSQQASNTSSPTSSIVTSCCNPKTQGNCNICKPVRTISQPAGGRGDVAVIFAAIKEEFYKLNMSAMEAMFPGDKSLQYKYLEMKWNELDTVMKDRSVGDNDPPGPVKKLKISVAKNLVDKSQKAKDITLSPNIHTQEPGKNPLASNLPLPSIASVLADQSSSPSEDQCQCDDCLYVTKSHMERSKLAKVKCRCHPCVLRDKLMSERVAKPWELVTIGKYEGDNYWLEPWIGDLFREIEQKKMTVKQAADKTGTSYGQMYRQYRERGSR